MSLGFIAVYILLSSTQLPEEVEFSKAYPDVCQGSFGGI